jgi:broad specificity phosphatase PhoE
MRIYVIRHGETAANLEGRLAGWTDDPLNENGIRLAEITGRNMKGIVFDGCYSSPLSRARKTAEIVLRESGNDIPVLTDERLKEIYVGDWEGESFRHPENQAFVKDIAMYFMNPFGFAGCPNGENARGVCDRTQAFLKELIARDDGKTYLVSTHGFALRAMLNCLYEHPEDFWQSHMPYNCCVNIIEANGGKARVVEIDKVYYGREDVIDLFAQ